MLDSDRKVNQNIYPDAVTRDRMHLIDPKSGQLEPIPHCLVVELKENTNSFCVQNVIMVLGQVGTSFYLHLTDNAGVPFIYPISCSRKCTYIHK